MLKVRLMGTKNDIKWFTKILQRNKKVNVLQISEPYANKGTNRFYRVYRRYFANYGGQQNQLCKAPL